MQTCIFPLPPFALPPYHVEVPNLWQGTQMPQSVGNKRAQTTSECRSQRSRQLETSRFLRWEARQSRSAVASTSTPCAATVLSMRVLEYQTRFIYVCKSSLSLSLSVCMNEWMNVCMHACMCIYIYICVYVCVHICVYIHIYIYTYIYIYREREM